MQNIRNQFSVWIYILIFILGWIILYPTQKYFIDPDGISYIQIAKHYANHQWNISINGYWSPLISWLMAILISLKLPVLFVAKFVGLIIGVIGIYIIHKWCRLFQLEQWYYKICMLGVTILYIAYAYYEVPVDFLSVNCVLVMLYFSVQKNFFNSIKYPVLTGVSGAFCYFAKYYNFPFYILYILVGLPVFYFIINKNKSIIPALKSIVVALSVFLLFSSPLIYLLSKKYDTGIIYCNTAKINIAQNININGKRNINSNMGVFLPAPNAAAIDHTEDLFYIQGKYNSVFDGKVYFINALKVFYYCVKEYLKILIQISIFIPVLLLVILILFLNTSLFKSTNELFKKALLIVLLYPLGYLLVHMEIRYVWLNALLLLLCGVYLLQKLSKLNFINSKSNFIIVAVFVFSFIPYTYYEIYKINNQRKLIYEIADKLSSYNMKGKIFSNTGDGVDTQLLAFLLQMQMVILNTDKVIKETDLPAAYKSEQINYYFYWHWKPEQTDTLSSYLGNKDITHNSIYGLQIFELNK